MNSFNWVLAPKGAEKIALEKNNPSKLYWLDRRGRIRLSSKWVNTTMGLVTLATRPTDSVEDASIAGCMELKRENERLTKHLELAESCLHDANYWQRKYESKAAECQEAYAEIGVLKGESE